MSYADWQIAKQRGAVNESSYEDYTMNWSIANAYITRGADAAYRLCASYNCTPGSQVDAAIQQMQNDITNAWRTTNEIISEIRDGNIADWEASPDNPKNWKSGGGGGSQGGSNYGGKEEKVGHTTFMNLLKLLYDAAYEYYGYISNQNERIRLADKAVTDLFRQGIYMGKSWSVALGPIDLEVNKILIRILGENTDKYKLMGDLDGGKHIWLDIPHSMATLGALQYTSSVPEFGNTLNDLSGWLGDLRTLAGYIQNKAVDKYGKKLEKTKKSVIKKAKSCIDGSDKTTSFPIEDLLADVDAINIDALMKKKNQTIYEAYSKYYSNWSEGHKKRYTSFVKNRFGTS